jgi:hypothetical protein
VLPQLLLWYGGEEGSREATPRMFKPTLTHMYITHENLMTCDHVVQRWRLLVYNFSIYYDIF